LTNADVSDLYSRVTVGTKIIVLSNQDRVARSAAPAVQPRFKTSAIY
jgi:hypothetical protein